MKNKWHDLIRKRLSHYREECILCLYPDGDYAWGTTKKNINRTLTLVNKIVEVIPVEAWKTPTEDDENPSVVVANGNWGVHLGWDFDGNKCRTVDLRFRNDDHTAWCIERKKGSGKFGNYDIGGS